MFVIDNAVRIEFSKPSENPWLAGVFDQQLNVVKNDGERVRFNLCLSANASKKIMALKKAGYQFDGLVEFDNTSPVDSIIFCDSIKKTETVSFGPGKASERVCRLDIRRDGVKGPADCELVLRTLN